MARSITAVRRLAGATVSALRNSGKWTTTRSFSHSANAGDGTIDRPLLYARSSSPPASVRLSRPSGNWAGLAACRIRNDKSASGRQCGRRRLRQAALPLRACTRIPVDPFPTCENNPSLRDDCLSQHVFCASHPLFGTDRPCRFCNSVSGGWPCRFELPPLCASGQFECAGKAACFQTTRNLTASLSPAPVISPQNPVTTMLLNRIDNLK